MLKGSVTFHKPCLSDVDCVNMQIAFHSVWFIFGINLSISSSSYLNGVLASCANNELICEWMARFKVSNTFEHSGMQGSVEQWSFA